MTTIATIPGVLPIVGVLAEKLPTADRLDVIHWQLDNILACGLTVDEARVREANLLPSVNVMARGWYARAR